MAAIHKFNPIKVLHQQQRQTDDLGPSMPTISTLLPVPNDHIASKLLTSDTLSRIEKFDMDVSSEDQGCCKDYNNFCCILLAKWWNIRFDHQRCIVHFVEQTRFQIIIIILVLIDCILVVSELLLDFIKLKKTCKIDYKKDQSDVQMHLAIEILHYTSVALLCLFVIEVLIKVYAFGRKWWNFHERKMEYLDAAIVFVSLTIDIYFINQNEGIADISLLIISFRLWRIIRIINSVAQSIRSSDENSKKHLAETYLQVAELLLSVSFKKTNVIQEIHNDKTEYNIEEILEKFRQIDILCQHCFTHCPRLSSQHVVTEVAHNLQEAIEQVKYSQSGLSIKNTGKSS
ncbi:unnamed protein product [Didymodactylos carnosus]|uniref:Voltage-gated hydrogen channel 1 n=1 Tax=Didymodactylos carnosus TaxID=1234261 RepID=A0A814H6P3_9BILA|nr:unnamed protein product [Didymodactylos carnosus]CAF1431288.1 unnamed protein product [Didymodactylos carnosus]CAF3776981.1 unnamed protein product [Didymodactylos carnosus]CAF4229328.1 unnamed protein product [Didymodactylos carnosus]